MAESAPKTATCLSIPRQAKLFSISCYDTLKHYRFGKKQFDHKFCPDCASSILIDFHNPEKWAINAFMIKDIEMKHLNARTFDRRYKLEPEYKTDEVQWKGDTWVTCSLNDGYENL